MSTDFLDDTEPDYTPALGMPGVAAAFGGNGMGMGMGMGMGAFGGAGAGGFGQLGGNSGPQEHELTSLRLQIQQSNQERVRTTRLPPTPCISWNLPGVA